jgi:hypothetical protein
MIMPSRTIKPIDSLIAISATTIEILAQQSLSVDALYEQHVAAYPKKIEFEKFLLSLNYLFTIGKLECHDEVIEIKFK